MVGVSVLDAELTEPATGGIPEYAPKQTPTDR